MKIVRPEQRQLPNIVQFHCSMEMTKYDIKNYLEKIYNIPVVDVRTRIALGKFRRDVGKGYIIKDDDIKTAYVVLVSYSHGYFGYSHFRPKEKYAKQTVYCCSLLCNNENNLNCS